METNFAKIFSDPDGRDFIVIEGTIVPLAVDNLEANNRLVDVIVRGLRQSGHGVVTRSASFGSAMGASIGTVE
jgi:hypothetical protein